MTKSNKKEIEGEESPTTPPTEAEETQDKTVIEQVQDFQEEKEQAEEEIKEIKAEKKAAPKPEVDISALNTFKDKAIKEFGLTEKVDVHGCPTLYYNGFLILKLLPRKNCRFGVWREMPEEGNKWRASRVNTDEEEQKIYEHIKLFIKANSKE